MFRQKPVAPLILSRFNPRFWRSRITTSSQRNVSKMSSANILSSTGAKVDDYIKNVLNLPQEVDPCDTTPQSSLELQSSDAHTTAASVRGSGLSNEDSFAAGECSETYRRTGSRRFRYPPPGGSCFKRRRIGKAQAKQRRSPESQDGVRVLPSKRSLSGDPIEASAYVVAPSSECLVDLTDVQAAFFGGEFYVVVTAPSGELETVYEGQPLESVEGAAAEGVTAPFNALDMPVLVGDPLGEHFSSVDLCSLDTAGLLADYVTGGSSTSFECFNDTGSQITDMPVDVSAGFGDLYLRALGEESKSMLLLRPGDSLLRSNWAL